MCKMKNFKLVILYIGIRKKVFQGISSKKSKGIGYKTGSILYTAKLYLKR